MYVYLILKEELPFHPQYKHSGTYDDRKYEELSYLILEPKKPENMRLHSGNSFENAVPA